MIQENIVIFNKQLYLFAFNCFVCIIFLTGCEEVSPYSYNCKNFNEEYLIKLYKNNDLDSARELATLYVECNPENDKKYNDLALQWSEKVMGFKGANEDDLKLYRALRNLDIDTGKPEE